MLLVMETASFALCLTNYLAQKVFILTFELLSFVAFKKTDHSTLLLFHHNHTRLFFRRSKLIGSGQKRLLFKHCAMRLHVPLLWYNRLRQTGFCNILVKPMLNLLFGVLSIQLVLFLTSPHYTTIHSSALETFKNLLLYRLFLAFQSQNQTLLVIIET